MVKFQYKHLPRFKSKLPTRRRLTSKMGEKRSGLFVNNLQPVNVNNSLNKNEVSDEPQDFQSPRKVAKVANQKASERYSLDTTNRFNPLLDHSYSNSNEMEHDSVDAPGPSNSLKDPSKKLKIPPIFVYQAENFQKLVEDIKSVVKCNFLTENKGNKIKVILDNVDDFKTLTAFYDSHGVQYHSYKLNTNEEISVVIRNLPLSLTDTEIKQELESLDFPVKKVTRLLNRIKNPIPLCIVDLENTLKTKEIFGLEKLFYSVVSVEPRRKPKDIPQCSRCQRFGHTKNFCNLTPRCVKCPGNHLYSECQKPKSEAPTCVNCSGNHSANYRGCDYFKNLKLKVNSPAKPNNKNGQNNPVRNMNATSEAQPKPTQTKLNVSFASAVKGSGKKSSAPSTEENVNHSDNETVEDDDDKFVGVLLNLIKPFIPQIKSFVMQLFKSIFDHVSSN